MIFSELYSVYYSAVARIIDQTISGNNTLSSLQKTVEQNAFAESVLTIVPALKSERWQLIERNGQSVIKHHPTMPLTNSQKSWLKAIFLEPKMKLFCPEMPEFLRDINPLFTPSDYVIYDGYTDGDDYQSEIYKQNFSTILRAINTGAPVEIEFLGKLNRAKKFRCYPYKLEYSKKDDKFRLLVSGCRQYSVIKMSAVLKCNIIPATFENREYKKQTTSTAQFYIYDERNALERALLHFAHFEKQVEKITNKKYLLTVNYDEGDLPEMIIRALSFGQMLEVIAPQSLRDGVVDRLQKQLKLFYD
ncbi:MAG: WYL domain-containing protein [Clostridia bacterium]|nr:WYL domain-containing protein [Clostridia bacterium]